MNDPLEIIIEGSCLGLRFGLTICSVPCGNLRVEEGTYSFGSVSSGARYHPLEAALVSASATGDWRQNVATVLGVDQNWIQGFLDGFDQQTEKATDPQYIQGYLAAEELRVTRFRRELPDR